jgi:hypothetical protein
MANFINMEIYGIPVLTYGLVGITTGVLAYATAMSGVGEKISETVSQGPSEILSNINPFQSAEVPIPAPVPPVPQEPTPEVTGGKKHRKTPRHKKSKRKGGKSHKNRK